MQAARAPGGDRSARRVLVLTFWTGLAIGLWLWWTNTPAGSVDGTGAALVEAGRVTGMIGGYALLIQILLMSRVAWLERYVGANDLLAWHRDLGATLVVMVLAHAELITLGYVAMDQESIVHEVWMLLTLYEDMISAFVATGLLIGIGLLAIRAVRAILPYEIWYFVHLTSYAVLLLSYGHQFATGRDLSEPGPGRWFWIGLYAFVLTCLVSGRLIRPVGAVHSGQHQVKDHEVEVNSQRRAQSRISVIGPVYGVSILL